MVKNTFAAVVLLAVTGAACAGSPRHTSPASQFLDAVAALCGNAYGGRVTANDPAAPNDPFVGQALVMHVRSCEAGRVLVPFHVGEDHSRTWVLTLHGDRIRLKHDHRHKDGTEDELTQYGGDSTNPGTPNRQEFPVDQFSIDLFTRTNRTVSNTNTWAMEVHPAACSRTSCHDLGETFAWSLT